MYGHIQTLAAAEKKGIEDAGGSVDVFQYDYSPNDPRLSMPFFLSLILMFDFLSKELPRLSPKKS